jgi:hypothetical protein
MAYDRAIAELQQAGANVRSKEGFTMLGAWMWLRVRRA